VTTIPISWTGLNIATVQISSNISTGGGAGALTQISSGATSGNYTLSNLLPNTTYNLSVAAADLSGNLSFSRSLLNILTLSSFYGFSGFIFTTLGTTGATGPTSLSGYSTSYPGYGTSYALTLTGGIQYWTVPSTGIYTLVAAGAGCGNNGAGNGIIVSTLVQLNAGQQILILVGQTLNSFTSGAGGTFIATTNSTLAAATPVLVAGGGGGNYGNFNHGTPNSMNATTSTSGQTGYNGTGGTNGSSGQGDPNPAGGAGFSGNAVAATTGALSFVHGGTGWMDGSGNSLGGFGGGGTGGGGYSGGGAGGNNNNARGDCGGGGSYDITNPGSGNAATMINGITNGYNFYDGFVNISLSKMPGFSGYSFTSFTFTSGVATGSTPPTLAQIQTYGNTASGGGTWTQNTTNLNVVNGIQYWTVPISGHYNIIAAGAAGGNIPGATGGTGVIASMTSSYPLIRGQVVTILVGQKGPDGAFYYVKNNLPAATSCGGGGTFVSVNMIPVLVAGGGGGCAGHGYWGYIYGGGQASTSSYGAQGIGSPAGYTGGGGFYTRGTGALGFLQGGGGSGFGGGSGAVQGYWEPDGGGGGGFAGGTGVAGGGAGGGGYSYDVTNFTATRNAVLATNLGTSGYNSSDGYAQITLATTGLRFPPAPLSSGVVDATGQYYKTVLTGKAYGNGMYVTSSSANYSTYYPYYAFDQAPTTWWNGVGGVNSPFVASGITYSGQWVQIKLPVAIILTAYTLTQNNGAAFDNFYIAGSNDGTTWTLITSQSTAQSSWSTNSPQTFTTSFTASSPVSNAYSYYRIICNRYALALYDWSLLGIPYTLQEQALRYPPVSLATGVSMNGNVGTTVVSGQSYGNGTYVTSTSANYSTYYAYKAFDQDPTTWWNGSGGTNSPFTASGTTYSGQWVQIQLPIAIFLTSYTLTQANGSAFDNFFIAGSNDASTWTLVDSQSTIQSFWSTKASQTFYTALVTTAFSYYRIICNANSLTLYDWSLYGVTSLQGAMTLADTNISFQGQYYSLVPSINIPSGFNLVSYTGASTTVTISVEGDYFLVAGGASGGACGKTTGGYGVVISSTVHITAGTVLKIIVGGAGGDSLFGATGGGGGTFILYNSNNSPILIAGGGGGGCSPPGTTHYINTDATVNTSGQNGIGGQHAGAGGTNGACGTGTYGNGATGGSGLLTAAPSGFWQLLSPIVSTNGANGTGGNGGFGGGGDANNDSPGGGGGYSGGGAGEHVNDQTWSIPGGGGGGSYDVNGTNNTGTLFIHPFLIPGVSGNISGGYNTGNGFMAYKKL
jgi:hypothetical protein